MNWRNYCHMIKVKSRNKESWLEILPIWVKKRKDLCDSAHLEFGALETFHLWKLFSWKDIRNFQQRLGKRLVRWPEEIRELKQQRRQKRGFALLQTLSLLISSRLRISNPRDPSERIHRIKNLLLDSMLKGTQPYYSIVWNIIERYSYAFFSCSGSSLAVSGSLFCIDYEPQTRCHTRQPSEKCR